MGGEEYSGVRAVMEDQLQRELEHQLRWYSAPWVPMTDRPPPGTGTYLVTYEADGRRSVTLKYWSVPKPGCQFPADPYWVDAGPYIKILAWAPAPGAWRG